jgi:DNA gyrase/topoisomerase IV subunit B
MAKEKQTSNKEIVALSEFEHVLMRPTMWLGSVEQSEEKLQIIEDGKLIDKIKIISVGFYKMLNEIVDNAFDEAKRMKGAMPKIVIKINSKTNEVQVIDFGGGFANAEKINTKTGQSNVETAMSMLRAGSNFYNDDSSDTLIGTNGVGAALVNMLSEQFSIVTTNEETEYGIQWNKFIKTEEYNKPRNKSLPTGTAVSYVPRKDTFKDCSWDREYIHTMFIFREFLKKQDPIISNLEVEVYFDEERLNLNKPFLPEGALVFKGKSGMFVIWEHYEGSTSASFVNGAICTGIHQKIFTDWVNDIFEYTHAHHFYETLLILNMPPKFVRFGDQNKTKYAVGRWEIQHILEKDFLNKLRPTILRSDFYDSVKKKIDERNNKQDLNNLKAKRKANAKKISDKYFPPSTSKGTLFIVEGSSALGSILQKRDPRVDGAYSLKGKIKNARSVADLASNNEIIDLMNILNLEPRDGSKCSYAKIAIATDSDPDGIGHIASLVINLFYKWFPQVIQSGKLNILITPLVSAEVGNKRKYFYSMQEWADYQHSGSAFKTVRYLKGLGSLSFQDWEVVMAERKMFWIRDDRSAAKYIDIAFGNNSMKRKRWLSGTI